MSKLNLLGEAGQQFTGISNQAANNATERLARKEPTKTDRDGRD